MRLSQNAYHEFGQVKLGYNGLVLVLELPKKTTCFKSGQK